MSNYQPQSGWPEQPPAYGGQPGQYGGQGQQGGYGGQQGQRRQQAPSGRPRRRRHRGRGWLIALVVLIVVLVAADFGAKAFAENAIASKIDSSGLGTKPSVNIEGFPFLTQIAAHDVKQIDISATNIPTDNGKVVISSLHATATGVHLNSSFNGATINQINGNATISFASLENALGVSGILTLSPDPADGPDAVQASAPIIGSVTGKIELTSPTKLTLALGSFSGLASLFSGALPAQNTVIDIPTLPAGLVVRSVSVTSQGIVATASAQNTTLSQ